MNNEEMEKALIEKYESLGCFDTGIFGTDVLCSYLADNGYYIKERRYAQQSGKLYTAFLVEYDGKKRAPTLFENSVRSPEFYKYTELEKKRAEKAIAGILASEKSDKTRLGYFEKILEEINSL